MNNRSFFWCNFCHRYTSTHATETHVFQSRNPYIKNNMVTPIYSHICCKICKSTEHSQEHHWCELCSIYTRDHNTETHKNLWCAECKKITRDHNTATHDSISCQLCDKLVELSHEVLYFNDFNIKKELRTNTFVHITQNHKCVGCYTNGHICKDHCELCGSITHKKEAHKCEKCSCLGHDIHNHCKWCNEIHKHTLHKCENCGDLGHPFTNHCTFCNGVHTNDSQCIIRDYKLSKFEGDQQNDIINNGLIIIIQKMFTDFDIIIPFTICFTNKPTYITYKKLVSILQEQCKKSFNELMPSKLLLSRYDNNDIYTIGITIDDTDIFRENKKSCYGCGIPFSHKCEMIQFKPDWTNVCNGEFCGNNGVIRCHNLYTCKITAVLNNMRNYILFYKDMPELENIRLMIKNVSPLIEDISPLIEDDS